MKQWTRHTIRKAPETSQCDSFFWVFVFLVLIPEHTGMQPSVNCKQQYNKNEPYLKAFWSILCHLICLHQELNRWSVLDPVHLNTISHVYPHGSQNTLTYLCFNASILTITPIHVFILLFNQSLVSPVHSPASPICVVFHWNDTIELYNIQLLDWSTNSNTNNLLPRLKMVFRLWSFCFYYFSCGGIEVHHPLDKLNWPLNIALVLAVIRVSDLVKWWGH